MRAAMREHEASSAGVKALRVHACYGGQRKACGNTTISCSRHAVEGQVPRLPRGSAPSWCSSHVGEAPLLKACGAL